MIAYSLSWKEDSICEFCEKFVIVTAACVKHLKEKSAEQYQSTESVTEKMRLATKTASFYLSPTSHDKIFGRDVVLFDGKGKPTILDRKDFDEVRDNWQKLLLAAGAEHCLDNFIIGNDFSAYDEERVKKACEACQQNFGRSKQTVKKHSLVSVKRFTCGLFACS